jgi:hypothetical protein
MTKQDDWKHVEDMLEKYGRSSQQYLQAYESFVQEYGQPGRNIEIQGKNTNGGSHRSDHGFFGSKKRQS